jgi:hypothetical protein
VYISRDVVFDETIFPFASLHPNAGALLRKEILLLLDNLGPISGGANNDDCMPSYASPMPTASPLQMPAENFEQIDQDLSQNSEETKGNFMPETDEETSADHEDDSLAASGAGSGENSPGAADSGAETASPTVSGSTSSTAPEDSALGSATLQSQAPT